MASGPAKLSHFWKDQRSAFLKIPEARGATRSSRDRLWISIFGGWGLPVLMRKTLRLLGTIPDSQGENPGKPS
jgi:hypothetical protein